MTELEVKITNQKPISLERKEGAYIATFSKKDDRILVFRYGKLCEVIDWDDNGNLQLQGEASSAIYHNLKKIKKMKIGVELE